MMTTTVDLSAPGYHATHAVTYRQSHGRLAGGYARMVEDHDTIREEQERLLREAGFRHLSPAQLEITGPAWEGWFHEDGVRIATFAGVSDRKADRPAAIGDEWKATVGIEVWINPGIAHAQVVLDAETQALLDGKLTREEYAARGKARAADSTARSELPITVRCECGAEHQVPRWAAWSAMHRRCPACVEAR